MRRKRPEAPGIALLPRKGRTPVEPIRKVGLRHTRGRWLPCDPDDRRATIVDHFDAAGRVVEAVYEYGDEFVDGRRQIAWRITKGAYSLPSGPTHNEVVAWFEQQAAKRRKGTR